MNPAAVVPTKLSTYLSFAYWVGGILVPSQSGVRVSLDNIDLAVCWGMELEMD